MSLSTTLFEGKYAAIPEHMRGGIIRWVEDGVKPGSFLWAVICNDLSQTFCAADDENLALIPLYVEWFRWQCPAACRGSVADAAAWKAKGGMTGLVKSE
jgi:hypothetical protein